MASFTPAGSGGIPLQTTQEGITRYSVENESLVTAATEVEIQIPTDAILFIIYNRTGGTTQVAFSSGESATKYLTLPPGAIQEFRKLDGANMSLYVQCPKAAQILEITYGHS